MRYQKEALNRLEHTQVPLVIARDGTIVSTDMPSRQLRREIARLNKRFEKNKKRVAK